MPINLLEMPETIPDLEAAVRALRLAEARCAKRFGVFRFAEEGERRGRAKESFFWCHPHPKRDLNSKRMWCHHQVCMRTNEDSLFVVLFFGKSHVSQAMLVEWG